MLVGLRTAQVAERFEEGLHGAIIGFPTASVNAADGPRIILPGTVCFPLSLHLPPWQDSASKEMRDYEPAQDDR
jgi:hypothetical protein